MRSLIILAIALLLVLFAGCGSRKTKELEMQKIPLAVTRIESDKNSDLEHDLIQVAIPDDMAIAPMDSKPLNAMLVIYKVKPSELSNHVPVRTKIQGFGNVAESDDLHVIAFPGPSDIDENSGPIVLKEGYFLDRSGFLGPGTMFLNMHYDEYQKIPSDSLTRLWFKEHVIPSEALQIEWYTCDCNRGNDEANVTVLNSMISKGLDRFKHPEISTRIHPRFGSELPKK